MGDTKVKKILYNLLLLLLIMYFLKASRLENNIDMGISILIGILLIKECIDRKEENIISGGDNTDEDKLLRIQREVLYDDSEDNEYSNDDYDASGGKEMNNIDNELNTVYKEYLKEQKEMIGKKEKFKDILVKKKMSNNIKKLNKTKKRDKYLKK